MLLLILKSSVCLAVFMVFYKLFLEKESMHHFKRFYLLGALVVSIVIPFITFTQYIEVAPVENIVSISLNDLTTSKGLTQETMATWQDYVPNILWSIYLIGAILFSFRFAINLKSIVHRIKTNPKHQYHEFTNVLLQDLIHPHTFFKYIFLNKAKYENNQIPNAVLLHEQTHAKQKHALDILCIEVLQIIFWFNPLLYFIKKDIKLNHEFLADQAVLQKGIDSVQYKQTLLTFSSNETEPQFTNAINYSLIKKRFTVMKTQTSKTAIWLKTLVLLPLLAITLYSFSDTIIIEKEAPKDSASLSLKTSIEQQKATKAQIKEYNQLAKKYNNMPKDNMVIKSSDLERLKYLYHLMSEKQKNDAESFPNIPAPPAPVAIKVVSPNSPPPPPIPANATEAQKRKYKEAQVAARTLKLKAQKEQRVQVREIRSADQRKKMEQEKLTQREARVAARTLKLKAQKEQRVQVREIRSADDRKKLEQEKLAYRESQVAARTLKLKAQKERVQVREIRSADDRKKLQEVKLAHQESQVAARTLKLKAQKERVKVREIRLTEDRKKLKEVKLAHREAQVAARVQKAKAGKERRIMVREIMPPPPPLPGNATPEQKRKYEAAIKAYKLNQARKAKDNKKRKIKDVPPPPPIPASASVEEREQMIEVTEAYHNEVENINEVEIEEVPELEEVEVEAFENVVEAEEVEVAIQEVELEEINEVPSPESRLDHVRRMVKKGAKFYLEGKEIKSDKAIQIVKSKRRINLSTKGIYSKQPKVYLTRKPIVVED